MSDFDRDADLRTLLSVSRNPALATMREAELTALAMHCHERLVGTLRDEARERGRVKRQLAKARKAAARPA